MIKIIHLEKIRIYQSNVWHVDTDRFPVCLRTNFQLQKRSENFIR